MDNKNKQVEKKNNRSRQPRSCYRRKTDGWFHDLLTKICIDFGIPKNYIYTSSNHLPGYFRPSKDWDFVIISPKKNLIAAIELKSQVGSFGNNVNNRAEEAIGSAVDLWTAYKWEVYDRQMPPWVGYLVLVEKKKAQYPPLHFISHILRSGKNLKILLIWKDMTSSVPNS